MAAASSVESQRKVMASGSKNSAGPRGAAAPHGAPVTFHARIRSSGYGAAPPRKPAWATVRRLPGAPGSRSIRAAGCSLSTDASGSALEARGSSYPTEHFPDVLDDDAFPPLAVSAAARGSSVPGVSGGTQASRTLARSQAAVPCGPVAALSYDADGTSLAVASHDGSVHVLQVGWFIYSVVPCSRVLIHP